MRIKFLKDSDQIHLPEYKTLGSAGMDLCAFLKDDVSLPPLGRALIPTGLRVEIPEGYEGQVRPRSGAALKQGITVLNSPGTVDSDYRGEIGVILINFSQNDVIIKNGDRIAQLVIAPVYKAEIEEKETLSNTDRGEGGFGSTN